MAKKPAGKPARARRTGRAPLASTSSRRGGKRRPTLLLAEDMPETGSALKSTFEAVGFRVSVAESLSDCTGLLMSSTFDVVVLDMRMPMERGSQVIEDGALRVLGGGDVSLNEIRAMRLYGLVDRDAPVIVLTAYPSVHDSFRTVDAGAYYVPKDCWPGVTEEVAKECYRLALEREQRRAQPRQTWLEKHYRELVERFPGKTIAVVDQGAAQANKLTGGTPVEDRLVFAADDREELRLKIVASAALRRCLPVVLDIPED